MPCPSSSVTPWRSTTHSTQCWNTLNPSQTTRDTRSDAPCYTQRLSGNGQGLNPVRGYYHGSGARRLDSGCVRSVRQRVPRLAAMQTVTTLWCDLHPPDGGSMSSGAPKTRAKKKNLGNAAKWRRRMTGVPTRLTCTQNFEVSLIQSACVSSGLDPHFRSALRSLSLFQGPEVPPARPIRSPGCFCQLSPPKPPPRSPASIDLFSADHVSVSLAPSAH